jgi:glycosyltransferase involved in cell wall biosynthesis
MSLYKLSVIIPTYNRYDFLINAVRSIKYYPDDYEIIIVNDGDEFEETQINHLQGIHKNTTIINACGKSVSKARNKGILAAQGEWLVLLDDDDIFHDQYLFKLNEEIEVRGLVDFFWCSVKIKNIDKLDSKESVSYKNYSSSYPTIVELYKSALSIGASYGLSIKKSILQATGLFDPEFNVGEDTELVMRLLGHGCVPGPIDFVGVTKFEYHNDRLSYDFAIYSHNDIYERIFAKNMSFLLKNPLIYRLLLEWAARVHLGSGATKKASKCLHKIFLLGYYWSFLGAAKYFLLFIARQNIKAISRGRLMR